MPLSSPHLRVMCDEHEDPGSEPELNPFDQAEWIVETPFGHIRHTIRVWTKEQWVRIPHANRPLDAVRLANGCYVRLEA